MNKTSIGLLYYGDLFEFNGEIYRVGNLIKNTNGYVACVNTKTHKVTRLYIDTTVLEVKENEN